VVWRFGRCRIVLVCIVDACKILRCTTNRMGFSQWIDDFHDLLGRMVLPPTEPVADEMLTSGVLSLNGSITGGVC
jgi:hypothetical protein